MTLALRFAVRSDIGLRREGNEDSAYAGPHLLVVADGMGGHAAGEVASATAVRTVAELDAPHAVDDLPGVLHGAVASASQALRDLIRADAARQGMGTTLTALLWTDSGHVAVGHIGDSRAYLLRDGQLYQITRDHTKVQAMLERGEITEAELETHPQRSVLVRALDGVHPVRPDVSVHEALPEDRYLLCSDGLSGVAPERAILQTLRAIPDPEVAAQRLIELACRGGAPDNITCIVADVLDTAVSRESPTTGSVFAGAAAESESGEPPVSRPDDSQDPDLTGTLPAFPRTSSSPPTPPQGAESAAAWRSGRPPSPGQQRPEPRRPAPAPAPVPKPEPEPGRPDETAVLRESIDGLREGAAGLREQLSALRDQVAELEAARERHDARISDLSGDAAETRTEVRELRAAVDRRGDNTLSMALAAQMRELKKLKADFLSLRDDTAAGGDVPSSRIAVRRREDTAPPAAREWPVPADLEDAPAPAASGTMAGYVPRFAGYSGIGADLIRRRAPEPAEPPEDDSEAGNEDATETEGDDSDQPWG